MKTVLPWADRKMSPARLLSTTLGDELKVATGGAAKFLE